MLAPQRHYPHDDIVAGVSLASSPSVTSMMRLAQLHFAIWHEAN
jgi:hypothetical protein